MKMSALKVNATTWRRNMSILKRSNLRLVIAATILMAAIYTPASAAPTYSFVGDFSGASNPNGVWSYGRKWTTNGADFDILPIYSEPPDPGWWFGNWGHGAPNIRRWGVWAKDNSNGYPAVRWTAPNSGAFNIDGSFTGVDSRGVDSNVYVTINGTTGFADRVTGYLASKSFSLTGVDLNAGDHVDFIVNWAGGVYSEYGWTAIDANISPVPEPLSVLLVGSPLLLIVGRRIVTRGHA